ncbi:glycoside hydrolase family 88/105 protein [Streptomyces alboflavus]|uniref:glycoside hydrolase family 88/105 protein n=1 Tax=Streptomyces alboflavus TaxID=67267 RepID=UPI0036CBD1B6
MRRPGSPTSPIPARPEPAASALPGPGTPPARPHRRTARAVLAALLAGCAALTAQTAPASADGTPAADRAPTARPQGTDWSVAMVESTTTRFTPATIGGWSYPVGLYLFGQYQTYRRTHDERHLTYIKSYVDRFVDSEGNIGQKFNNLDSIQAGRLLVILHRETGDDRYRVAARKIRDRLKTYPRTEDGGFWHADTASRAHQLWSDGVYMVTPFLVEYGKEFDDETYTDREAVEQLNVYARHLQADNGLFQHAYDESRTATWADKDTGRAPEQWCRAIGWYSMAAVNVLDATPRSDPGRPELLGHVRKLAAGIARAQDPATGRWFQVVNKGTESGNWTETSCSSMFTFALSRAAEKGYVSPSYESVARRGHAGVLKKISLGSDGLTDLTDISIGTNVGDYAFYIARPRQTNDFHGLGAFLIMNEQLRKKR